MGKRWLVCQNFNSVNLAFAFVGFGKTGKRFLDFPTLFSYNVHKKSKYSPEPIKFGDAHRVALVMD